MNYQQLKDIKGNIRTDAILRMDDNATIPNDDANADWQDYQAWVADGNIAQPALDPSIPEKLEKLYAKRNFEITKNITVEGNTYFADPESQNLLNQTLASHERGIENVLPRTWILANGTTLVVQYADLLAVNAALVTRTSANYANYLSLYAQIAGGGSPDITQGWG